LVFDRLAHEVNAVCEFSARSLSERDGFRADRIRVIQNGVKLPVAEPPAFDKAALLTTLGLDRSRRYIASIARFHPVKDHPTLLRAFVTVAAAQPDVDLLLVGDGTLRRQLEALTKELGIERRVQFLGVRSDVLTILRAVELFTLTSLSEAASITLLEAMSCGTPVVVTAVGGNPEIVRDGIDGLLAPRGDAAAIARAMLQVLSDPVAGRRMGAAAAARVRDIYRLERTVDRYYELYVNDHAA
jgi:glycosyltransferase involved in cell wall biosynthesis